MIFPLIVFKEELPVLFDKGFNDRKFIYFEFLIFGRMGIIERPLRIKNVALIADDVLYAVPIFRSAA